MAGLRIKVSRKPQVTKARRDSTCPYCRAELLAGESAARCIECDTLSHAECWHQNGRHCSVFGCPGTRSVPLMVPSAGAIAVVTKTPKPKKTSKRKKDRGSRRRRGRDRQAEQRTASRAARSSAAGGATSLEDLTPGRRERLIRATLVWLSGGVPLLAFGAKQLLTLKRTSEMISGGFMLSLGVLISLYFLVVLLDAFHTERN